MKTVSIRILTATALLHLCLSGLSNPALAQAYRCADASGQSQYQQWPCAQANAQKVIHVADARTSAQRTQATEVAEREQKLLREMSRSNGSPSTRALPLTKPKKKVDVEPDRRTTTDLKRIPRKRDFRAVHKAARAEHRPHLPTRKSRTAARSLPAIAGR